MSDQSIQQPITEESVIELGFRRQDFVYTRWLNGNEYVLGDTSEKAISVAFMPQYLKVQICEDSMGEHPSHYCILTDNCNTIQDLKNLIYLFNIK